MIKDFKEFANVNPSALFQNNLEITRPQADLFESGHDGFVQSDANVNNEKFVFVKRTRF